VNVKTYGTEPYDDALKVGESELEAPLGTKTGALTASAERPVDNPGAAVGVVG